MAPGSFDQAGAGGAPTFRRRRHGRAILAEIALFVATAFLISRLVVTSVGIVGSSMEPALLSGDRALVPRFETWLHRLGNGSFGVGDIVFFPDPLATGNGTRHHVIKRIVAVAGETVELNGGNLYIDGVRRDEPYLGTGSAAVPSSDTVVVPAGHVFVLGDNRAPLASQDSRRYGPVAIDSIVGRATLVVWPPLRRSDGSWRLNLRRLSD